MFDFGLDRKTINTADKRTSKLAVSPSKFQSLISFTGVCVVCVATIYTNLFFIIFTGVCVVCVATIYTLKLYTLPVSSSQASRQDTFVFVFFISSIHILYNCCIIYYRIRNTKLLH